MIMYQFLNVGSWYERYKGSKFKMVKGKTVDKTKKFNSRRLLLLKSSSLTA